MSFQVRTETALLLLGMTEGLASRILRHSEEMVFPTDDQLLGLEKHRVEPRAGRSAARRV